MQVTKEQLLRQQLIMKVLGFFHGTPDGNWGPTSITAKKEFEKSKSFVPGIPNNGLPFRENVAYPAGMSLRKDGLLYHPAIDAALNAPPAGVTEAVANTSEAQPSAASVAIQEQMAAIANQTKITKPVQQHQHKK